MNAQWKSRCHENEDRATGIILDFRMVFDEFAIEMRMLKSMRRSLKQNFRYYCIEGDPGFHDLTSFFVCGCRNSSIAASKPSFSSPGHVPKRARASTIGCTFCEQASSSNVRDSQKFHLSSSIMISNSLMLKSIPTRIRVLKPL